MCGKEDEVVFTSYDYGNLGMLFPLARERLTRAGSNQRDRSHSMNPSVHHSSFQHVCDGSMLTFDPLEQEA